MSALSIPRSKDVLTPTGLKYADAVKTFEPYNKLVRPIPEMREHMRVLIRQGIIEARPVYALVNNRAEGSAPLTIQGIVDQAGEQSVLESP